MVKFSSFNYFPILLFTFGGYDLFTFGGYDVYMEQQPAIEMSGFSKIGTSSPEALRNPKTVARGFD